MYNRQLVVNDSENISSIDYDIEGKVLRVNFTNSTSYLYQNITPALFGTLCCADSVGSELNRIIIRNASDFPYRKI